MLSLPRADIKRWARSLGARCDLCPLSKETAVGPAPPKKLHRLTVIGEAPGRAEVKLGGPFLGASGKLVDQLMAANKLRRDETYLTNAALCRSSTGDDDENDRAADCCAPRLLSELHRNSEHHIPLAPLGKSSTKSLLGVKSILLARGFVWRMPEIEVETSRRAVLRIPAGTPRRALAELKYATVQRRAKLAKRLVLPSIHPAFVLRSEVWHPILQADFRRIARAVRGQLPRPLADQGTHLVTQDPRKLYQLGPVVSLDVETTHAGSALLADLLCVGFSDGGWRLRKNQLWDVPETTIVLWPWKPALAKPLTEFLKTRTAVVGHNLMNFDKIVLEMHGVRE